MPPAGGEAPRVPVLLLAGFLGSGKTTLLNRILTAEGGARTAVIVNEFGEVPIDGKLVVRRDEEVVELANGCICCTVRGDLAETLHRLLARRRRRLFRGAPFERLVIEASGLASPGPAVQTLQLDAELAAALRVEGVVTLAHAAHVARQMAEHPEAAEQVAYADAVVLNHADAASAAELDAAEAAVRAANAHAPVVRAVRAEVDLDALLAAAPVAARAPERDPAAAAPHTCGVGTVVLSTERPVSLHALKMWLHFVAARRTWELMRVKGLLRCPESAPPVVVQGVYQMLELGPGEGPPPAESVVVLIGRDLDRAELEAGFARCLADPESA